MTVVRLDAGMAVRSEWIEAVEIKHGNGGGGPNKESSVWIHTMGGKTHRVTQLSREAAIQMATEIMGKLEPRCSDCVHWVRGDSATPMLDGEEYGRCLKAHEVAGGMIVQGSSALMTRADFSCASHRPENPASWAAKAAEMAALAQEIAVDLE